MKLTHLKVQHLSQPMGVMMDRPVFTWQAEESTGRRQKQARMMVALDEGMQQVIHDSGFQALSSLGYEADMQLAPRTRYWWQVTAEADDGDRASAVSWFETGKRGEAWQGRWIALPGDKGVHPVLRRKFTLPAQVESARLYICGLGLYEAEINGRPVCDECLTPYMDGYNHLIQSQAWDVTALLHAGDNELSVMLGAGWYKGRFAFLDDVTDIFGDRMQLIAEMHVQCCDGSQHVIASDEGWEGRPSPVLFSNIYDGEIWDDRLCGAGAWQMVEEAPAPQGKLVDRLSPPVRVTGELGEPELILTPKGEWVLDFRQEITGWAKFTCELPEGAVVKLFYGEILQEGCFYQENLRTAKARYEFTSSGKRTEVRPHFTFYGFRYVKVEGMTEEQIRAAGFTAQVVHSDLEVTGEMETSNPKVNRLIANVRWGQRGNFLDIPTDCPQRDERMGWTGDAEVFCPTACYNMDTAAFYRKYMANMRLDQADLRGAVPHVVPDLFNAINRRRGRPTGGDCGACAWGDAAAVIAWTVYTFYGDAALLREMYPGMKDWAEWIYRQDEENCGGSRLWTCGFHFGDWLVLDNPDKTSSFGGTKNDYVASAYYFYTTTLVSKAAEALGLAADAAKYRLRAEEIRQAFRQRFFTAEGVCLESTQTALVLALAFDLAPENSRERCVAELKGKLDQRGIHLDTGFVGTPLLCPVLSDHGLHDYAVTLLLQEDYPSWLYEVNMGATTVWERWNSIMPNGLVSDTGMNSMNHYAYGSVMEWMYRTLAGLSPAAPGFKRALIAPQPDERLSFVRCAYRSASGLYQISWEQANGRTTYRLHIPFDCEADVRLPGLNAMTLPCGDYEFTV